MHLWNPFLCFVEGCVDLNFIFTCCPGQYSLDERVWLSLGLTFLNKGQSNNKVNLLPLIKPNQGQHLAISQKTKLVASQGKWTKVPIMRHGDMRGKSRNQNCCLLLSTELHQTSMRPADTGCQYIQQTSGWTPLQWAQNDNNNNNNKLAAILNRAYIHIQFNVVLDRQKLWVIFLC